MGLPKQPPGLMQKVLISGMLPTGIDVTIVLVSALITTTVLAPVMLTYKYLPSGLMHKPEGFPCDCTKFTDAVIALVAVLNTCTALWVPMPVIST